MTIKGQITDEEKKAFEYVKGIKRFYSHMIKYFIVVFILFLVNYFATPEYFWVKWVALGWGLGLLFHGLRAFEIFNFFGPKWEKKQIEKKIGKKL